MPRGNCTCDASGAHENWRPMRAFRNTNTIYSLGAAGYVCPLSPHEKQAIRAAKAYTRQWSCWLSFEVSTMVSTTTRPREGNVSCGGHDAVNCSIKMICDQCSACNTSFMSTISPAANQTRCRGECAWIERNGGNGGCLHVKDEDHHAAAADDVASLSRVLVDLTPELLVEAAPIGKGVVEIVKPIQSANRNGQNERSMILLVLPWVEYQLLNGVRPLFLNMFGGAHGEHEQIWIDLLLPCLRARDVVLIFHPEPVDGEFNRNLQYQFHAPTFALWLARGVAEWFGAHDYDEYAVPTSGRRGDGANASWDRDASDGIRTRLEAIDLPYNFVKTKLQRVLWNDTQELMLHMNRREPHFAPGWQKYYARVQHVDALWVHEPSCYRRATPMRPLSNAPLRMLHYKRVGQKTQGLGPWSPDNVSTTFDEDNSQRLDETRVLAAIHKRYGMSLEDHHALIMKRYASRPEYAWLV